MADYPGKSAIHAEIRASEKRKREERVQRISYYRVSIIDVSLSDKFRQHS